MSGICVRRYGVSSDGAFGHNGDNGLSESSLKYNPRTGDSFCYAAVGEAFTFAVAYEMISK